MHSSKHSALRTLANLLCKHCTLKYVDVVSSSFFFLDEETGKRVDGYSISIYRRWNYENDIAAVVCYVSNETELELEEQIFNESVAYAIQKLSQGHDNNENSIFGLTIFYSRIKIKDLKLDYLEKLSNDMSLVYTLIPIDYVNDRLTYLSICGVRHQ